MHILIIARHFPPEISGGARRPSLYASALRKLGHKVTIITPFKTGKPDSFTVSNKAIDRGNLLKYQTGELQSQESQSTIFRAKDVLRTWMYWPDNNIKWVKAVIAAAKKQNFQPDWILTTSPPESIHFAGRALSKHFNVPWVAELRDTWVEMPHRKILANSKIRAGIERRIAKNVLAEAHAVTAVSEAVMSEARKYVKPGTPECIITHFSDPPPLPFVFSPDKLNLVHTGGFTLSDRRRTLPPLLKALDEIQAVRPELVFHIAGRLTETECRLVKAANTHVQWHGLQNLEQSRALQAGADGLVLYTPSNSHALPGKYAEYALTGRPILYLGDGDWMSLVMDAGLLQPLKSGALTIEKNKQPEATKGLTHIQAAQELIRFLENIT